MNCRPTPPPDALFFISRFHRGSVCPRGYFLDLLYLPASVFTDLAQCPWRGREKRMHGFRRIGSLDFGMTWACYRLHVSVCSSVRLCITHRFMQWFMTFLELSVVHQIPLPRASACGGRSKRSSHLPFYLFLVLSVIQEQFWLAGDLRCQVFLKCHNKLKK